jgi:hypothetical protein
MKPMREKKQGWETVIDFTKFYKNGIPIEELIKRLKKMNDAKYGRRKEEQA